AGGGGHEDGVGLLARLRGRPGGAVGGSGGHRLLGPARRRVARHHLVGDPGAAQGQADRPADEPGADDGGAHQWSLAEVTVTFWRAIGVDGKERRGGVPAAVRRRGQTPPAAPRAARTALGPRRRTTRPGPRRGRGAGRRRGAGTRDGEWRPSRRG